MLFPRLVVALVASLNFVAGCERSTPTTNAPTRGEPNHTYTVRGKVEMLPDPSRPTSEFVVYHEPIPGFVNPNGTLGMPAMSMPFPVKQGLSLKLVNVNDIVEIDFAVWTTPGVRGFEATAVRVLPPTTVLNFAPATPKAAPTGP
jgi:Copper binding periplasmic protein CusF